jgi:hypothetical protein
MTIQEILREFNVDHVLAGEHHHARPGWIAIRTCPFCSSSNYHLGYNLRGGFFNCWKCKGHSVISTLVRVGVPFREAEAFFRGREPVLSREEREARGVLVEPRGRGELLKAHRKYLKGRGFDPDVLRENWEIEGIDRTGRSKDANLAWRIYVPIIFRGQRVSWTARSLVDEGRRYISASAAEESVNHKHVIYGMDHCRHSIIAVEGPTDAWRVGPGAGALFGMDFTAAQVLLISSFPLRIVCFDSAPDAQRRARELCAQLSPFPGRTFRVELDADDPGSAPEKEIKKLRKMAGIL